MIRYVEGDLVKMAKEGKFEVIGHCCNCYNTMGAGIAPQIKSAFPEAYAVDCKTVAGDETKLGTITYTINSNPIVVNLYGQFDFTGRRNGKMDLNYDALRSALKLTKAKFSGKTFGFPMMGSGLAGGDWDIIEKIIEEEMMGEYVTIVQYVP